jgi:RimJ/RimL family protein N-acetyltransferase
MHDHPSSRPIFCKAIRDGIVYEKKFARFPAATISFRALDLDKDLSMVHGWVNMDYTRTFWQMRGSIGLLRACYQCIQQNPFAHSFIGLMDGVAVCQFDIYKVSADELSQHIAFREEDCGFHLLMAPLKIPVHGLTLTMVSAFLEFYFAQNPGGKMFAEPDIQNLKSINLLERAGFEKGARVELSYKTADVYSLTAKAFHAKNQLL